MPITDWPAGERPREKLLQQGPATLSDAELLAIFLRTGCQGKTAVDLARELLLEHGSLRALLEAGHSRFCRSKGLGTAKYTQLQAVLEMSRRHLREVLQHGDVMSNPDDTCAYLTALLRDRPHEVFGCLFLDNRHRVLGFEELFHGTINGASVHPRVIVKRSLDNNAAAVILAHNHPSGVAEASQADIAITRRLVDALALVDIRVLDHLIIGDGEIVSFASQGLL